MAHWRWVRVRKGARHCPRCGASLNLLLVLQVLAARAFRRLRILLLALGLVLNQPLFDRLLATEGVRIHRLLYELASHGTANVLVLCQ